MTIEAYVFDPDVWFVDDVNGITIGPRGVWPVAASGPTPPAGGGNRMGGAGAIRKPPRPVRR